MTTSDNNREASGEHSTLMADATGIMASGGYGSTKGREVFKRMFAALSSRPAPVWVAGDGSRHDAPVSGAGHWERPTQPTTVERGKLIAEGKRALSYGLNDYPDPYTLIAELVAALESEVQGQ